MGMKALTRDVNRAGKWPQRISQDTAVHSTSFMNKPMTDDLNAFAANDGHATETRLETPLRPT
jgi:hypothetical protein